MRNISLRSLMLAEELSHIKNEVELIHPSNDEVVKKVLAAIGFDVRHGVEYIPSFHRDMSGKAAIGYQAVGEYNVDPKYNKFIDTLDRVIVAGLTDASLAREMSNLLGKRLSYKNDDPLGDARERVLDDPRYYSEAELLELGYTMGSDEPEYDAVEDDYESISAQIKVLEDVRDSVRGKQ